MTAKRWFARAVLGLCYGAAGVAGVFVLVSMGSVFFVPTGPVSALMFVVGVFGWSVVLPGCAVAVYIHWPTLHEWARDPKGPTQF